MTGRDGERNKDYRRRCRECTKFFTVRTGTILEETCLPPRAWAFAPRKACPSKKGISALQPACEMEITHKSALFGESATAWGTIRNRNSRGTGKPTRHTSAAHRVTQGSQRADAGRTTDKASVIGIAQREGDVRIQALKRSTPKKPNRLIAQHADPTRRPITDELNPYKIAGGNFRAAIKS